MNSRVTLTDVAKRAGVHHTTVSLALRNHPRLPKATRQRLCDLAEHMGYRPDPLLHALSEYRNGKKERQGVTTLAYLTNWNSRLGWKQVWAQSELFQGAEGRAGKLGYKLEHFWRGEPQMTDQRLTDVFRARGITGILMASDPCDGNVFPRLDWDKFSAIKVGFLPRFSSLNRVAYDRPSAIYIAFQRVIAAGYRRIGVVLDRDWEQGPELIAAVRSFEQNVFKEPFRMSLFVFTKSLARTSSDGSFQFGQENEFENWVTSTSPEVLIGSSGQIKPALESMNLSVPRDVAFVDIMLEDTDGETAGVKENHRFVGEVAVDALASHMNQHISGIPAIPTTTLVNGTWVEGKSLPQYCGQFAEIAI